MLVQLLKIGKRSAWYNSEDTDFLEGKVFQVAKGDAYFIETVGKKKIGYISSATIILHRDHPEIHKARGEGRYDFFDVEFKILRL